MIDNSNLKEQTKLKTNPIPSNSVSYMIDKKPKAVVAHAKGLHILEGQNYDKITNIKLETFTGNVTCLTISDQLVFFAYGMQIGAAAMNGKVIFNFQTFLAADKIDSIHVHGYRLWVICGNLLNEFLMAGVQLINKQSRIIASSTQKTQDIQSHIFQAKINHSILCNTDSNKPFLLLLMSNNQINCYQKRQVTAYYKTQSPPTYAIQYKKQDETILIGTMNGQLIFIQPKKNKIKHLQTIKSEGKINCINMLKNGFMVCKDKSIQFWNFDKELLGKQDITDKISSSIYIPQSQIVIYGTQNGNIILLCNYQKLLRESAKKNSQQIKDELKRQIQILKNKKFQYKKKISEQGNLNVFATSKPTVKYNLLIDYNRLCYCVQFSSNQQITRLILKGKCKVLDNEDITFEGIDEKQLNNYMIRVQNSKSIQVYLTSEENYYDSYNYKLNCLLYFYSKDKIKNNDRCKGTAVFVDIDLKPLSLHHKIKGSLNEYQNQKINILKITGKFKYFEMNLWLNGIFNDFGSAQGDTQSFSQNCYESIINKSKLFVQYKNELCQIYSESVTPLYIIKKYILAKTKQKNINLSYSCQTSQVCLKKLIKNLQPEMMQLQNLKNQYELLPGLQELKSDIISQDLQKILQRKDQIKQQYEKSLRHSQQIRFNLIQIFKSYRGLNNKDVADYQLQDFENKIKTNINIELILKIIIR